MHVTTIKRSRKLGFSMIPMVDVVFLLIIFFLVSNTLAQNENEEFDLSVAASSDLDKDAVSPRVTVNIHDDGQMFMAGRPITRQALSGRLKAARENHGDDVEVRIRCGRTTPYNQVAPVMLACTRSGIWNVTFAVYRPEGGQEVR